MMREKRTTFDKYLCGNLSFQPPRGGEEIITVYSNCIIIHVAIFLVISYSYQLAYFSVEWIVGRFRIGIREGPMKCPDRRQGVDCTARSHRWRGLPSTALFPQGRATVCVFLSWWDYINFIFRRGAELKPLFEFELFNRPAFRLFFVTHATAK